MTDTQASQPFGSAPSAGARDGELAEAKIGTLESSGRLAGRKTSTEAPARPEAPTEPLRSKSRTDGPRKHSPALQALIDLDPFYRGCQSGLECMLVTRLRAACLPLGEAQFYFVPGRKFRFDRAWPGVQVAVEVQGGTWTSTGAHSRGSGIERDCLKLSIAAALGWRVLPVTRAMIEDGTAVELIRQALETRV